MSRCLSQVEKELGLRGGCFGNPHVFCQGRKLRAAIPLLGSCIRQVNVPLWPPAEGQYPPHTRGGVSQGEAEAPVHRHQRKAAGQGHGNQAEQTVAAGLRREILTPVLPRGVAVGLLTQTNSAWARRRGGREHDVAASSGTSLQPPHVERWEEKISGLAFLCLASVAPPAQRGFGCPKK